MGKFLPIPLGSEAGAGIGGVLDTLGGLFGGKGGVYGHEAGDIGAIAKNNGITDAQAADVVAWQANHSKDKYDDLAKYLVGDNAYFLRLRKVYNDANPNSKVLVASDGNAYWSAQYAQTPASAVPMQNVVQAPPVATSQRTMTLDQLNATLAGSDGTVVQTVPEPTSAAAGGIGGILKQYGKAGLDGAIAGATDVFMKTPQGVAAQNAGAKQWLKDNALYIAGALIPITVFITWLAGKAFKK